MLSKTLNGHNFEIQFYTDMGGALEEVALWCHTCDEDGSELMTIDVLDYDTTDALRILDACAEWHAEP